MTSPCRTCGREFVSDNTPLAQDGYCLWCRLGVPVVCERCGGGCEGRYDGLKRCPGCRGTRLGEQQYEDKQRALLDLSCSG